ncbi:WD40-repeat-containing domain protein [Podospora appendiculata]|uniref:ASTRA-associated protein 1 n=1 Tax=Podospora appendiculata TaxID=314037 RepID=A0AAE1CC16_9PEZI|nr:WD40-repeat-containing domain protein [Podospora appendiculata]
MATESTLPAQPKSILRGHKAQVHAAAFIRRNERLLTGDAEGFVVAWDLTIMRPKAVWRPHTSAILGVSEWGPDKVITHGRDNKLIVWQFGLEDEARLSTTLPLDPSTEARPQPWLLHVLEVNTMNFCSFSHCPVSSSSDSSTSSELLVAVPNTLASEAIDIFHLPSQTRRHTVKLGDKNGMVMALSLFHHHQSSSLTLVAGYENGVAIVAHLDPTTNRTTSSNTWAVTYKSAPHSQPILSLDISPKRDFFLTSGADAVIAKHPLPHAVAKVQTGQQQQQQQQQPLKAVNTKHAGQQSLRIRSDGLVFATAGWDAKVRVYSAKTLKEVAVLKWHQVGCFAAAFAEIALPSPSSEDSSNEVVVEDRQGGGTDVLAAQAAEGVVRGAAQPVEGIVLTKPNQALTAVPKLVELTVRDKRIIQARTAHWLAAGSKDGKVSLWDIF